MVNEVYDIPISSHYGFFKALDPHEVPLSELLDFEGVVT